MSDQVQGNDTNGGASQTVPGQAQQSGSTQPGYVTLEQYNQGIEALKSEIKKNYQGVQSKVDRSRSQIREELNQFAARLKEMGIELTPEQKRQYVTDRLIETLDTPSEPEAPGQVQLQPERDGRTPLQIKVEEEVESMLVQAGITIEEDDPEAANIVKAQKGTVYEYLRAWDTALQAKKVRLSKTPRGTEELAGRLPTLSGSGTPQINTVSKIRSSAEAFEEARRQGKIK